MKTNYILIFNETSNYINEIVGGIYTGVNKEMLAEIENDILYIIPLKVSGRTYRDRRADLRNKAIEYQNSWYDFCGFSYGELAVIQDFFTAAGKKYGLLTEFKENGII